MLGPTRLTVSAVDDSTAVDKRWFQLCTLRTYFFLFRFGVTDRGGFRRPAAAFADRGRVLYLPGEPGGAEGGRVSPSLGASAVPAWWRGAPGLVAQGVCACVCACVRAPSWFIFLMFLSSMAL